MERILFLIPPHIRFEAFRCPAYNATVVTKNGTSFGSPVTDMPLGALILSAYVKKNIEAETSLLDFNIVLNKIPEFNYPSFPAFFRAVLSPRTIANSAPTIVAISALFAPSYQNLLDLGECCRELFPDAMIVAGGGVPTSMYADIFRSSDSFDALCFGEGERPLLGLLQASDRSRYLAEHPAWITQAKFRRGEAFIHDFIENLDEIPFPDFDLCDTSEYGLNPAINAYASIDEKRQNFHVMTSRGCPHRCCFCASHTVHGRRMRYYSVQRVREDFTRLVHDFGTRTMVLQDDHFLADRPRALEIVRIVRDLGVKIIFQNGLALYALDREMLEALKEAGVDHLVLSVESGSGRVLKEIMHKPLTPSIVARVVRDCRELGIYTNVNIMIGLPGETKQDIEEARLFLRTLDANWFIVLCATPLAGSEMLEICLRKNYVRGNYLDCDFRNPVIETEDFSPEYIQKAAYAFNLELNFVNNSDFRLGQYETALKGFENAIRARSDHAIAHYYAAQCHERLGNAAEALHHRTRANTITAASPFWQGYAGMFNLPLLEDQGAGC